MVEENARRFNYTLFQIIIEHLHKIIISLPTFLFKSINFNHKYDDDRSVGTAAILLLYDYYDDSHRIRVFISGGEEC